MDKITALLDILEYVLEETAILVVIAAGLKYIITG